MYSYTKHRCFWLCNWLSQSIIALQITQQIGILSESTVIEPYGAIIVQSISNFGISVWAYCSCTANPLASINSNECTALQLLTLAWFIKFILYTKYECTVIQKTGVLIAQWFKSENSLGSVDSL